MKKLFLILTILLVSISSYCQGPWKKRKQIEYSGFFDSYFWRGPVNYYITTGTSVYYGDLSSSLKNNKYKPAIGIGVNYNMWSRVLLGAEFQYFGLGATDQRQERNLIFKSNNLEFTGYARFEILYDRILKHTERNKKPRLIKPYILGGLSMIRYTASATPNGPGSGDTLPVEPTIYPKWSFVIPAGIGIKFTFSHRFAVSTQLNYRITFTDYLDQVSELRGSADKKDSYTSLNVMFEFTPGAKPRKKKPRPNHSGESSNPPAKSTTSDSTSQSNDIIETPTEDTSNDSPNENKDIEDTEDSNDDIPDLPDDSDEGKEEDNDQSESWDEESPEDNDDSDESDDDYDW